MKTYSKIRFGFVGAGQIASSAADAVKRHSDATLVAVHDLNQERLKDLTTKLGVEASPTVEELFADDGIDAVYIATPNKFHVPLTIQALEAGKHVILEKPFAMNLAEAQEAARTARDKGLVLMLGMNQRFSGDSQKIYSLARDGKLGEIYHAKAYWRRRTGIPKIGTWFSSMGMAGGGCLYDIGVHMLDLGLYLMGNFEPVSVLGSTYTKFGNRGLGEGGWGMSERSDIRFDVDDFASAFIRFRNGASMTLDATWACHQEKAGMDNVELFGTEAGATARPAKIYRFGKNEESQYEIIDQVKAPIPYPHCERFHNFINHLLGKEELCVKIEEALAVQKILDAIAESSRTGKSIDL